MCAESTQSRVKNMNNYLLTSFGYSYSTADGGF
jgi:hypothetical protein